MASESNEKQPSHDEPATGTYATAGERLRRFAREHLPHRDALMTTAAIGLLLAWWISFHEIACGCLSIRATVPLSYTYESCYAFGLGTAIGAIIALMLLRKTVLRPRFSLILRLVLVSAVLNISFAISTVANLYLLASACELALNALGALMTIICLQLWTPLSRATLMSCLFLTALICVAVNNGLMPMLIHEGGGVVAVTPIQLLLLGGFAGLIYHLCPSPNQQEPAKASRTPEKENRHIFASDDTPFPWPLILHLSIYCCLFGIMHVESSTLISPFLDRNLPYGCGALVALVLYAALFLRKASNSYLWPKIRTVVFPLTMVSLLLLPYLDSLSSFIPVAFVNCAVVLYELIAVLGLFAIARESHMTAQTAAAVGLVVASFSFFAGSVLCHALINFIAPTILTQDGWNIAVFLLLIVATLWVGDDRRAGKLWGMRINLSPQQAAHVKLRGKCAVVARTHNLTPRETEIMEPLAEGNRPPQIAETLVISIATARTHVKNIYAKCGTHSQVELIALVESVSDQHLPPQAQC